MRIFFRRSEEGRRRRLDDYDREYDRGKTKKVRGVKGANVWQDGNVFQRAQNAKRSRRDGGDWGHGNGKSSRRHSSNR